jgi:hypothetical protein
MEQIRKRMMQDIDFNSPSPLKRSIHAEILDVVPIPLDVEVSTLPQEPILQASACTSSNLSSRGWSFKKLMKRGKRFKPVPRISATLMTEEELLRKIEQYEQSGDPLIIEDWHKHPNWPKGLFDLNALLEQRGDYSTPCYVPAKLR